MAGVGAIFGAMMGSFACCQARRLRRKQKGLKELGKWSECESCGHRLRWYENIPIVSWLAQGGKCRKCKKKIGTAEIWSEAGLAAIFAVMVPAIFRYFGVTSGIVSCASNLALGVTGAVETAGVIGLLGLTGVQTAFVIAVTALILAVVTAMWMVAIYDMKWGEMPTVALIWAIGLAMVFRLVMIFNPELVNGGIVFEGITQASLLSLIGAGLVLPFLYFGLYFFSKEKLVGSGDWMLALAIALLLGDWWLAFFELFLANAIASVVAIGLIIRDRVRIAEKKRKRGADKKNGEATKKEKAVENAFGKEMTMKIPFGPYLVIAYVAIVVFAPLIAKMILL